jgi:PAS domain S-box-containing protein
MVNSALEQLTGHRRADLLGHSCRYLLGACVKDGQSICDAVCPFLHPESKSAGAIEGYIPTTEGKRVWIEISYGRVTDPGHHLASVIHIVRDLTQRKEVERLKDEFLSMVTHELRTPLHHIKGFATTLLQTDVQWDATTQRDFLETINREADRLAKLVENILQMSRIEAGGLQVAERRWCRAADLTAGALQRLRDEMQQFRLQVLVSDNLPPVFADEQGVEAVIANLVENASKYSPPGSEIILQAEARDGRMLFCVADQGPGIPVKYQSQIFERFYRVDVRNPRSGAKPVRPTGGMGLGLAICKRIVEAHSGRIWVESAPGTGSCFFFDLPLGSAVTTEQGNV